MGSGVLVSEASEGSGERALPAVLNREDFALLVLWAQNRSLGTNSCFAVAQQN